MCGDSAAEPVQDAPAPETIIESAPPLLLGKLRQLDTAINALREQQTALLHGYAFGRGWNLQTHNVGLDTNVGQITVSPI